MVDEPPQKKWQPTVSHTPATRVAPGWLAASVCTWTAFAAHAHSAPTTLSLIAMVLITCISAAVAGILVGKKFSLWATSLVVLASQGLYHLSLSVMSHPHGDPAVMEHAQHTGRIVQLGQHITAQYADVHTESMFYAPCAGSIGQHCGAHLRRTAAEIARQLPDVRPQSDGTLHLIRILAPEPRRRPRLLPIALPTQAGAIGQVARTPRSSALRSCRISQRNEAPILWLGRNLMSTVKTATRLIAVFALSLLALFTSISAASAHDQLIGSSPKAGATIEEAPKEITLEFSGELQARPGWMLPSSP